jgi:hypothetical protein
LEAIIFSGPSESGKTRFYQEKFLETHVRIATGGPGGLHEALLFTCLAECLPFVVDDVNPLRRHRVRLIDLARHCGYKSMGYRFSGNEQSESSQDLEPMMLGESLDELYSVKLLGSAFIVKKEA